MKISTKGRYAIRMLLDLAEHSEDGFISLKDIAERQGVSKKYLEQIIPIFHKSDILITSRGFQGGYKLAKSPDNYTVGEILRLKKAVYVRYPVLKMILKVVKGVKNVQHFLFGKGSTR